MRRSRNLETRLRNGNCPIRSMLFMNILLLTNASSSLRGDAAPRTRNSAHSLEYHDTPRLHWKTELDGFSLGVGNVVEHSPFGDDFLYVTTLEGYLNVFSASDGALQTCISPSLDPSNDSNGEMPTSLTSCNSGIAFGELPGGSKFLAYSVVDQALVTGGSSRAAALSTRVIAVSIPDHEVLWTSERLPGGNSGSPVVYSTTDQERYVVLTHNTDTYSTAHNATLPSGHFSVLRARNGQLEWSEEDSHGEDEEVKGYGPPGVAHNPVAGHYLEGEQNRNDLVVWGTYEKAGRGNSGSIFAFQLPVDYLGTESEKTRLATTLLKNVHWTSLSTPVFGNQGLAMYMAVAGDMVRGWGTNTRFDETATWGLKLAAAADMVRSSFTTAAPTLSNDEKRLFVITSGSTAHCLDTQTGSRMWDIAAKSPFFSEARVSPDDQRVYFVQAVDGIVSAHNQMTGAMYWSLSCDAFEENCAISVRSNFALSPSGQYLYYADVGGKLIALALGDFGGESPDSEEIAVVQDASDEEEIIGKPTDALDDRSTVRPGIFDDIWSKEADRAKSSDKKSGPSVGASVVLVILSILVLVGTAYYILLLRREKFLHRRIFKIYPKGEKRGDDTTAPEDSTAATGVDASEDASTQRNPTENTNKEEAEAINTERSVLTPDRMEVRLSPTPKVSPLKEDYSFGASVMV